MVIGSFVAAVAKYFAGRGNLHPKVWKFHKVLCMLFGLFFIHNLTEIPFWKKKLSHDIVERDSEGKREQCRNERGRKRNNLYLNSCSPHSDCNSSTSLYDSFIISV